LSNFLEKVAIKDSECAGLSIYLTDVEEVIGAENAPYSLSCELDRSGLSASNNEL